jgi:serine/threonine-protein kinase HipA
MTSKIYEEAYVWIWLPEELEPKVAGLLSRDGNRFVFNYGQSYLAMSNAIALYTPELPLTPGRQVPLPGLSMANCLRDASPDAWGRRVLINRLTGKKGAQTTQIELDELTYLLESGSDRAGALDFQRSPNDYIPRARSPATLEELQESTERVDKGIPLTANLAKALQNGTSLGGARPKALIDAADKKYIAKFSSQMDTFNIVKGEYIAMRLAALAGLHVAPVHLTKALGKDVLLIERFDRQKTPQGWTRKGMVSALTLLELDEMMARYASYESLAEIIRHRFQNPKETLRELFGRLVFNILCGNTDDHARNHAAFWDDQLRLTPAYDIAPHPRAGEEASQAMLISGEDRSSRLSTCRAAARHFLLNQADANTIIDRQVATITDNWAAICDESALSGVDRALFWQRQFLNPFAFRD